MNIVYFIWVSDSKRTNLLNRTVTNQSVLTTCRELGVSVLSLKKHTPNTSITVYTAEADKSLLSFAIPFLEDQGCRFVFHSERDQNDSLFIKFLFFRKALDEFKEFISLDVDTLIVGDLNDLPSPKMLYFAPYDKFPNDKHPLDKHQYGLLKKYFGVKKKFGYMNSHIVNVIQRDIHKKFWNELRYSMDDIIKTFMSRCNGIKTYEMNLNDELYIALALHRIKSKIHMISMGKLVGFVRHGKRFNRSPNKSKYEEQIPF